MDPIANYDHIVIIDSKKTSKTKLNDELLTKTIKDFKYALGDRITHVNVINIPSGSGEKLGFGFHLVAERENLMFIKGPESKTKAGNEFKLFWDPKCELRYVDGNLHEYVSFESGENVSVTVINHVLSKKMSPSVSWHHIHNNSLDFMLKRHDNKLTETLPCANLSFYMSLLDILEKFLHESNDSLPLNLKGVHPLSSEFRGTSTFPPLLVPPASTRGKRSNKFGDPKAPMMSLKPLYVLVDVESTVNWPSTLTEFRLMKKLLILKLQDVLLELKIPVKLNSSNSIDLYLRGAIIRVVLNINNELKLLQTSTINNLVDNMGSNINTDTIQSSTWRCFNISLLKTTGLLQGVARANFNTFTQACALARRWMSCHGHPVIDLPNVEMENLAFGDLDFNSSDESVYDSNQMTNIALELLILYAAKFVPPVPHIKQKKKTIYPVSSPVTVFLRFLHLLSHHDWNTKPLLINLDCTFTETTEGPSKVSEALKIYHDTPKERLPAMVLCTPVDIHGCDWTKNSPSREGLSRLSQLAKLHCNLLRAMLVADAPASDITKGIFTPNFAGCSFKITVDSDLVMHTLSEAVHLDSELKKLYEKSTQQHLRSLGWNEKKTSEDFLELTNPGINFWPLESSYNPFDWFLKSLHKKFGGVVDVRYDIHGSNWVAVTWKSLLNEQLSFKSSSMNGFVTPCCDGDAGGSSMTLSHDKQSLTKMFLSWFEAFITDVQYISQEHKTSLPIALPALDEYHNEIDLAGIQNNFENKRPTFDAPVTVDESPMIDQINSSNNSDDEADLAKENKETKKLHKLFGIGVQPKLYKSKCK